MMRACAAALLALAWCAAALPPAARAQQPEARQSAGQQPVGRQSVGMVGAISGLVLPGSELEVAPLDHKSRVVVRILDVHPHGTARRYDLEYTGLEPGTFDLRTLLRRKDGTTADDLPAIQVEIGALRLPAQVQPNELEPVQAPRLGGYQTLLWVLGGVWVAGLLAILLAFRRKRATAIAAPRPPTLAERLRPIVEAARSGRLPDDQRAELERLLLGCWRHRLGLEQVPAAQAIPRLRQHDEAGALLRQLELWLHAPPGSAQQVDVVALLQPYENMPADHEQVA